MMGKQNGQLKIMILDIDSMILEGHFLKRIEYCGTAEPPVRIDETTL